ncbi:MAG: DUF2851 family protein [Flavobacteriaceae bacterium]
MNEHILAYLWQHPRWWQSPLSTVSGNRIQILKKGLLNKNSGPDFLDAQIQIDDLLWVGHVELHVCSSDWYAHNHESDSAYDNVILHVVWEYDVPVFDPKECPVFTLELRHFIPSDFMERYRSFTETPHQWIPCEAHLINSGTTTQRLFFDRLFVERLSEKTAVFQNWLKKTRNDWEAVLFVALAKGFGLVLNGASFAQMALSIPFSTLRHLRGQPPALEALFLGQAGILDIDTEDAYLSLLKENYLFIKRKHNLKESRPAARFFRARPINFPTIRLSQLAQLYESKTQLFDRLIETTSLSDIYKILDVGVSSYWRTHFVFGKTTQPNPKKLSKPFKSLLIINTVIPFLFCHHKAYATAKTDLLMDWAHSIKAEQNSQVAKFKSLGLKIQSALDSQAVLQLKTHYCTPRKCLQCAFGHQFFQT